jgi:hypothetical protein
MCKWLAIASAWLGVIAIAFASSSAQAGVSPNTTAPPTTIRVTVSTPGQVVPGAGGGTTGGNNAVPCAWNPDPATPADADAFNRFTEQLYDIANQILSKDLTITITYYSESGSLHAWNGNAGQFERRVVADCTNATDPGPWSTGDLDWWTVRPPSPDILIPGVVAEATAPINAPTPDINPPRIGTINVGMWLAVREQGPITIRANLGPLWAEATATIAETTFDLDDGRPIVCDGTGTPIPASEWDDLEQEGPCGHTFRNVDDLGPTEFTISSRWTVTWRTSAGNAGSQPDIVTSTTMNYCVREIITVGSERPTGPPEARPGRCSTTVTP